MQTAGVRSLGRKPGPTHTPQLKFHVQQLKNKIPRLVNKTQYSAAPPPKQKCPHSWMHSCTEHRFPVYALKASILAEKYLSYSGVCVVWAMQTLMTKSDLTLAEKVSAQRIPPRPVRLNYRSDSFFVLQSLSHV